MPAEKLGNLGELLPFNSYVQYIRRTLPVSKNLDGCGWDSPLGSGRCRPNPKAMVSSLFLLVSTCLTLSTKQTITSTVVKVRSPEQRTRLPTWARESHSPQSELREEDPALLIVLLQ